MEQGINYNRPYLDPAYREDGVKSEWEDAHAINRLRQHVRQLHSVLEHVDQLVSELDDERNLAIRQLLRDQADTRTMALKVRALERKLSEYEVGNGDGRTAGEQSKAFAL